jgi:hypothetical protein
MPSERRELPNAQFYNKIDLVINEATQFLSQYIVGMERFEERFDAAKALVRESSDIQAPSEVFRPFSEFKPL